MRFFENPKMNHTTFNLQLTPEQANIIAQNVPRSESAQATEFDAVNFVRSSFNGYSSQIHKGFRENIRAVKAGFKIRKNEDIPIDGKTLTITSTVSIKNSDPVARTATIQINNQ